MKWKLVALVVILGCLCANTTAHAVDWEKIFCLKWCLPDCKEPKCCDDYCPKPLPCVPKVTCFGCDDYRPKCEPCTKKICCFLCDDYCYKCPPVVKCPPCNDLRCVPTSTRCVHCGQVAGQCSAGCGCSSCQSGCDGK